MPKAICQSLHLTSEGPFFLSQSLSRNHTSSLSFLSVSLPRSSKKKELEQAFVQLSQENDEQDDDSEFEWGNESEKMLDSNSTNHERFEAWPRI